MKIRTYKTLGGSFRIAEIYDLSKEDYLRLKKIGLPVYKSMSGLYNLRDSMAYSKEQILAIKERLK